MIPDYYQFFCPVKVASGLKALSNLPYEMELLGVKKAMLVTDQGVVAAGLLKPVLEVVKGSGVEIAAVFDKTPPDSSSAVVSEVAEIYKTKGCDGLLALGGGSCIDTTKGVAIVVSEGTNDLMKFQGMDRLTKPIPPLVVIPTTAGTGSEVTLVAVIKDTEKHVKMPFISDKLYPDLAILDPKMTVTMPPKITAATGMDALTHAMEAFYGLQKNPISDAFAVAAVDLIFKNLVTCVEKGDDEKARLAMANAALLAGVSFSNAMVGVVHALAHALGGVCGVPHGVANAIFLPWGLEFNLKKVPERIAGLAPCAGVEDPPDETLSRAKAVIQAVRDLAGRLHEISGLPITLKEAGVPEDKLEEVAKAAIDDGSCNYNPEDVTYEDALGLLKKAF